MSQINLECERIYRLPEGSSPHIVLGIPDVVKIITTNQRNRNKYKIECVFCI